MTDATKLADEIGGDEAMVAIIARAMMLDSDVDPDVFIGMHGSLGHFADTARALLPILSQARIATRREGMEEERKAIMKWLRDDADLTEAEAAGIVKNTAGDARRNAAEWAMLVGMKRGIATAIEQGAHHG